MITLRFAAVACAALTLVAGSASAASFSFSTGDPNGLIATATRPDTGGKTEIETGDDFVLTTQTQITGASFTGLLTGAASSASIGTVVVEIYRVFPLDSQDPPSGKAFTRVNSPSDVALDERSTSDSNLTFAATALGTFTAANSVQPGGIHAVPNQFTGGNGSVTGTEVRLDVSFDAFNLAAGHYFFVPQVEVSGSDDFLWLSAPKPIVVPGTPFTDLQSWTRDEALQPDWLRVGTDITHQGPFNASFSLTGVTAVPEVPTGALMMLGLATVATVARRRAEARSAARR